MKRMDVLVRTITIAIEFIIKERRIVL